MDGRLNTAHTAPERQVPASQGRRRIRSLTRAVREGSGADVHVPTVLGGVVLGIIAIVLGGPARPPGAQGRRASFRRPLRVRGRARARLPRRGVPAQRLDSIPGPLARAAREVFSMANGASPESVRCSEQSDRIEERVLKSPSSSVRGVLAANLKRERTRRGLSLSELSRLSRIGKATLSQLESATGNPTIETVFSLSRALEMPISDLLDTQHTEAVTVVRAADVDVLSGEGVDLRPLRRIEAGGALVELYDQQVSGGSRQPSLGHAGTEHTVVQSGALTVEVDGHTVTLGPGDYVSFDASLPHCYEAGDEQVRSVLLLHYRSDQRDEQASGRPAPH